MGASPKLVSRYYDEYVRLFPRRSIVLVTVSPAQMFLTSEAEMTKALLPAIQVLQSKLGGKGSLAAAVYSNGGIHSLTHIARLWKRQTGTVIPLIRTLVDSAPGDPEDLASGHRALITAFPATIRPLCSIMLWIALYIWRTLIMLGLSVNPIGRLRDAFLDTALFSPYTGIDEKAHRNMRTFVYSREDIMVAYTAVQAAAAQSSSMGWEVRQERFDGTAHVAHGVKEKERYWGIVGDALT
jgi:hypothetical protein